MRVDLVVVFQALSVLAILFVIGRLYHAIKLIRDRVTMLSNVLIKLKVAKDQGEVHKKVQDEMNKKFQDEVNKKILEEGF
jgi:predicted Holliday junction resolvase-like endonuclease